MANVSERLGKTKEGKKDLEEVGRMAKKTDQQKLGQVGEAASGYGAQGKSQVHGLACACEQFICNRPLRSVMMAAGLGYLTGRIWKRH